MPTTTNSHSRTNAELAPTRILAPDDCVDIVALYHRVAEHSPFPIAMTAGQTHQLCGANQAFRQLLGADSLVLLAQSLIDAMPTAETERVQGLLDLVYQTGEVAFRVAPQPIHAERDQMAWSYSAWPIPDDKGCSVGLMLLIHDTRTDHHNNQAVVDTRLINEQLLISGLREQELAEQLQHQLAFTNTITTSLSEGLYVLDMAGRCTFLNPAAELLLGWTANELYGQQMSVVIPAPLLNSLHLGTTL